MRYTKIYPKTVGATPKEITSTSESNCFPNSLGRGLILAIWPSKPSKIADKSIAQDAKVKWLSRENIIEIKPQIRLKKVTKFANWFISPLP